MLRFSTSIPVFLLIGALALSGCDLFESEGTADDPPVTTGVIVANSGNFSDQNGFLTVYDPATQQTRDLPNLGAFAHHLTLADDSLYAITNTFSGGRIEVHTADSVRAVDQIASRATPRTLAIVDAQTAYVTSADFTGNPGTVSIYDRTTGTLDEAAMEVGFIPEDVAVANGKAFVANYGSGGAGTTLSVIDTATNQVQRTIDLGCDGPNELAVDGEGELVVVCQGKTVYNDDFTEIIEQTNGQILFVHPDTETVVDRIELDQQVGSANGTQGAAYAPVVEELHVIDGTDTVLRVDTDQNALGSTLTVPGDAALTGLTAVAYDGTTQRLYLGRYAAGPGGAPDVTSAGSVVVLDRSGALLTSFVAGPAPGHIVLRRAQ